MKSSKFLDFFPPPDLLDVPYGALVFSDYHIKAMRLNRRSLHPDFSFEAELAPGVMESGVIKNEEEVVKILSSIPKSLGTSFVKMAVPDHISYVFTAKVPALPGKDLEESISFIMEENVPLPFADISFDFSVLGLEKGNEGMLASVAVTAVSKSIIDVYVRAIQKAGIEPIFCCSESQAMAKAVIPKEELGYFAMIYTHKDMVSVYITSGQNIIFSSFAQLPPSSSPELFASFVRAESIKAIDYCREKGLFSKKDSKEEANVKCILCGIYEISLVVGNLLSKEKNISVSIANVWTNAFSLEDYIPDISFDKSLLFGGAIGLFLDQT